MDFHLWYVIIFYIKASCWKKIKCRKISCLDFFSELVWAGFKPKQPGPLCL